MVHDTLSWKKGWWRYPVLQKKKRKIELLITDNDIHESENIILRGRTRQK
jgi:hypothetical protein